MFRGATSHRFAAAALVVSCWLGSIPARAEPSLPEVLSELSEQAQVYRNDALRFTCEETVIHYANDRKRAYKFDYIYVYDETEGLSDYRVPKRRAQREDVVALLRAYSWIFIFQEARRDLFDYEMKGPDQVLGRRALRIGFTPRPPFQENVNDWFGTAWVDEESFQLLRVEALRAPEYEKQRKFENSLRPSDDSAPVRHSSHHFERVYTDYTVERDGLRLPGEVITRRSRFDVWNGRGSSGYVEHPVYRVRQRYRNYRFFGVTTDQEIDERDPFLRDRRLRIPE